MPIELEQLMAAQDLKDGVWLEYRDGLRAKIAYVGRAAYRKATMKQTRKIPQHKLEADPALWHDIGVQVAVDTLFLDFEGVTVNGAPLPNTRENRVLLMGSHEFSNWVNEQSKNLSNFQAEATQEDVRALKSDAGVEPAVGEA